MVSSMKPEQLIKEAKSAYQKGDYQEAANSYLAAANGYQEMGDQLSAAEMQNNASVSYLQAGEPQSAMDTVVGTPDIFAEANDLRRQGIALANMGSALEALGQLEEAVQYYQQSGSILEEAGEGQLRVEVMKSLSALQLRTGHQLEALATMQAGLDKVESPTLKQRFLNKILRLPYKFIK